MRDAIDRNLDALIRDGAADAQRWRGHPTGSSQLAALQDSSEHADHGEPPPASLPGYTDFHKVRRGSQGVVYSATQMATRRTVAVKLLHAGRSGGVSDRRRFEREVQILIELRHPSVVTVHDAGVFGDRCYLVMDFVDGVPLDQYLAEHRPGPKALLELLAVICDAVNAAHLRGVLHRDLKPANVLVDGAGHPCVVDFGLAKELAGEASAHATQDGQFVGSIPWASPEQIEGRQRDIDTRSDVYSLGVVLFQALSGRLPFDREGSAREWMNRIVTAPPPRPRALVRSIPDEVETIVLKCLAKERERRYQTAGDLSRELRRYLRGEAIEAKRDSLGYQLRKLVWRHRGAAAVAGMSLLAVVLAYAFTLAAWRQTAGAEERLLRTDRESQAALALMLRIDSVRDYLGQSWDYEAARPELGKIAADIDAARFQNPANEYRLRTRLAEIFQSHLDRAAALPQREKAVAAAKRLPGDGGSLLLGALQTLAQTYTPDDPARGRATFVEAQTLVSRLFGEASENALALRCEIAITYREAGDSERYERLTRDALADADRTYPDALHSYAQALAEHLCDKLSRYADALPLQERALASARRMGSPASVAHVLHSFGSLLLKMGNYERAEQLMRECVELRRDEYGPHHREIFYVFASESQLGEALTGLGRHKDASDHLRTAWLGLVGPIAPRWTAELGDFRIRTARRMVELYECWSRDESQEGYRHELAHWQAVLEELGQTP